MSRYAAFLRGVNLGKRTVKSAELKATFETLGFTEVKTLLASGNVLFDARSEKGLKQKIETGLEAAFGFPIPIVLRSLDELRAMVAADPFGGVEASDAANLHVMLFDQPIPAGFTQPAVPGDFDVPMMTERELFFLVYKKSDGTYLGRSSLDTEKRLPKGTLVTMRNWNTILKAIA
ncbi:MAG: DUF1697 domain-containing protein [Hyphomicrobiales bacterium]|nr:MAG: DUF1697 domain-containing protein [Hyphomicrobiales bacterium]